MTSNSVAVLCCRNRYPYMGSEVWTKLQENITVLQKSIYLPTLLDNLHRKSVISEDQCVYVSSLGQEEGVKYLINLLVSRYPQTALIMCDAVQETHPDIAEKVGLGQKPASDSCTDVTDHNHVVKSYHAVLTVSTEPHKHSEENSLKHMGSKHSAFM